MNQFSAYLRLLCGASILILSFIQNSRMRAGLQGGGVPQLFGHPVALSEGQMYAVLTVIGLVGLFLVVSGLVALFKR